MRERFDEVLNEFMDRYQVTAGSLSKLSGVPRQTIISWTKGGVKRPSSWESVVKIASGLRLTLAEANRLMRAAGHKRISDLIEHAREEGDSTLQKLVSFWMGSTQVEQATHWQPEKPPFQAPPQITDFTGRHELNAAIEAACRRGGIFALQGMTGVGKTTLAICLAHRLRAEFADGVLWSEVADVANCDGIRNDTFLMGELFSWARSYGRDVGNETTLISRSRAVRELLAEKRVLIILNDAQRDQGLKFLLPAMVEHGCTVLITTQNRNLLPQYVAEAFEIAPFAETESVAFLETVLGRSRIDSDPLHAQQINTLLGGLPLALRIVVSDLKSAMTITLAEYYEALHDERTRLGLLGSGNQTTLNVRASFTLSFRRLNASAQRLFARLCVFGGFDFSIEAVQAISDLYTIETKQTMGRLYTRSLVEASGKRHYRLHPLLKVFAREKLAELGESWEELVRRSAEFYAHYATNNRDNHAQLQREWHNIKSIINATDDHSLIARIVDALTTFGLGSVGFLDTYGYWQEAVQWLTGLIANTLSAQPTLNSIALVIKRAAFAFRLGQYEQARADLQQASKQLDQLPSSILLALHQAYLTEFLARLAIQVGDAETAMTWLDETITRLQQYMADPQANHLRGYLHILKGQVWARQLHRFDPAEDEIATGLTLLPPTTNSARLLALNLQIALRIQAGRQPCGTLIRQASEAIELAEQMGNQRLLANLLLNRGICEQRVGATLAAQTDQQRVLKIAKRIGDNNLQCLAGINLGMLALIRSEYKRGIAQLEQTIALAQRIQYAYAEACALATQAQLWLKSGDKAQALVAIEAAQPLCAEHQFYDLMAHLYSTRASIWLDTGKISEALDAVGTAIQVAQNGQSTLEEGIGLSLKGVILDADQRWDDAEVAHQEALAKLVDVDLYELARGQLNFGRHHHLRHNHLTTEATALLKQSLTTFQQLGSTYEIAQIEQWLSEFQT